MSKNKDFEKRIAKEIEKIKPEKELKLEKLEKLEQKEFEKRKEWKDKIEYKERIKEYKEFEKAAIREKGVKEIEVPDIPGGEFFRAEKPEEAGTGAAKPKDIKEDPELKIQKEIEKIKPEKEFPDKFQKEIEKIKPEKEFPDKLYKEKELEKIKPEKEFPEKFQKDLEKIKPEKEFEKGIAETPQDPSTQLFKRTGSAEDRLGELEDAVTKLTHFIGVDLRPDLTTGALKGEPDVGGGQGAGGEAKPDDKKKPK